jgi:hypothetical protein
MQVEMDALTRLGAWELVETLPKGRRALRGKWVLTRKHDGSFKARWVALGFAQRDGIDCDETFAPVCHVDSFKLLLALCVLIGFIVHHLDVKTAFLNGRIDKDIYVYQPDCFEEPGKERWFCHLLRALYGLRQSPRLWNKTVDKFIREELAAKAGVGSAQFVPTASDRCVYVLRGAGGVLLCILVLFVDDFFLGAARDLVLMAALKRALCAQYKCTDLGLVQRPLGLECEWSSDLTSVKIHLGPLIRAALRRFGLSDVNTAKTPRTGRLSKDSCPKTDEERAKMRKVPYREMVGVLIYLLLVRLDIAFAVGDCARFLSDPGQAHYTAVKRIFRYLSTRADWGLTYSGSLGASLKSAVEIICFSDADYNGCPDSLRSTTGYIFLLAGGVISYASRRQKVPSHSSTESELYAVDESTREAMYLRVFLAELGFEQKDATPIYEDNNAVICLSKSCGKHRSVKHLQLRKVFVNDKCGDGTAQLLRVDTEDQLADILTKNASPAVYLRLLPRLGKAMQLAKSRNLGPVFLGQCGGDSATARFCLLIDIE